MNCVVCGRPCHFALKHLGGFCGEEHRQELLRRHHALLDELRQEAPALMPAELREADFERLALKWAAFLLDHISPPLRRLYQERARALLGPLEMAAELKGHILRRLPPGHVEVASAPGLARLVHADVYAFRRPVPAALVVEAIRQAGLLPLLGVVPDDRPGPAGEEADP
jgi:hypothetical protein